MHDESPGGIACKDRALAFWTDQSNFNRPSSEHRTSHKRKAGKAKNIQAGLSNTQRFGAGFLIGTIFAAIIGG